MRPRRRSLLAWYDLRVLSVRGRETYEQTHFLLLPLQCYKKCSTLTADVPYGPFPERTAQLTCKQDSCKPYEDELNGLVCVHV